MSRSTFARVAGVAALVGGSLYFISMTFGAPGLLRAMVPGSIILMIVGVLGLHARLWGREGRLGWLGFGLVGVGLLLGLVGMAGSAVGILDPNPIAPIINTGEHAGLVFIGAGMLLWGLLTLRERALGGWSFVPLVLGLLSLTAIAVVVPNLFGVLERSVVPPLFAIGWMLLGYALVTSRPGAAPDQPQALAA